MNVVIEVDERDLKSMIELSEGEGVDAFIHRAIKDAIKLGKKKDMIDQNQLLNSALHEAHMKDPGEKFILKDLLGDSWVKVISPRAFGRSFRKKVESMEIATLDHKTIDNKAVYIRKPDSLK